MKLPSRSKTVRRLHGGPIAASSRSHRFEISFLAGVTTRQIQSIRWKGPTMSGSPGWLR